MVSCGEASGDLYAEGLVEALRSIEPGIEVFGFGGPRLGAAGAELVGTYEGVSVTGLVEVAAVLRRAWDMLRRLRDAAATRRPDVFVAIDFPDFNLRLLPAIHALGIPIVYYVSPQLWAWRPGRIETLKRFVTRMAVIFPFERDVYERAGVPVEFVGHPLIERAAPMMPRAEWLAGAGLAPDQPVVALLPGSRPNEVRRILPVLCAAVPMIAASVAGVQFVVARAPHLEPELFAAVGPRGLAHTPLWVYVLREAELNGGKLSGVGARIVAETFHRAMEGSTHSIVRDTAFTPSLGPNSSTFRMVDLLLFAFEGKKALLNPNG